MAQAPVSGRQKSVRDRIASRLALEAEDALDLGAAWLAWLPARLAVRLSPSNFGAQSTLARTLYDMRFPRRALRHCELAASPLKAPTEAQELATISTFAILCCIELRKQDSTGAWEATIQEWVDRGTRDDPVGMLGSIAEYPADFDDLRDSMRRRALNIIEREGLLDDPVPPAVPPDVTP